MIYDRAKLFILTASSYGGNNSISSVKLQLQQASNEEGCLSGYGYLDGLHVMRSSKSRIL